MDKNTIVIGIDHGWANMKSRNFTFTSGVKEITTEPALFDNVVEYEGKYYKVGGNRLEVKETKVLDDNYYILTLAAMAKELDLMGIRNAHVFLGVGLPITRFGAEKQDFIEYLSKNKVVEFRFEKKQYQITLDRVSVYPQCYGAVADRMANFPVKQLVVDIGSWTVDIMPIINRSPDESMCVTAHMGIITCMKSINEQCVRQLNGEVDEYDIQEVMMHGYSNIDPDYLEIIKEEITKFTKKVYRKIGEMGYNMKTTPIVFVGGGATVMKLFGGLEQNNITYIEDIRANAKGYELLARTYLERVIKRIG